MYELVQVGENTFYIDCPAKIGIFRTGEDDVVLIDSGSDKDAAKKTARVLDEKGWTLRAIFNTHYHADHIGGNSYLQTKTGCRIYSPGIESVFAVYPILEPALLYGGCPVGEMHNKFLMAKESVSQPLSREVLPEGLEVIKLPGHSFDMVGFRTSDDVVFLADSLISGQTLKKYRIGYVFNIADYLESLEKVKGLKASCFVPSHAPQATCITDLAQLNIDSVSEVISDIRQILGKPVTAEDLIAELFSRYCLEMNVTQRFLVGSTVNSYLSYLCGNGLAEYCFEEGRMLWKAL